MINEAFPSVITDKLQVATISWREKGRELRKQRATADVKIRYVKMWVWLLARGTWNRLETNGEEGS